MEYKPQQNPLPQPPDPGSRRLPKLDLKSSIWARFAIVGFLTLLLIIPTVMIMSLITERSQRRDAVTSEISKSWGGNQVIVGPILTVPYEHHTWDGYQKAITTIEYAHFLPESLVVAGSVRSEHRNRGIYDVIVYTADLDISAVFESPAFTSLNIHEQDVHWDDAVIALGVADPKGIKDLVEMKFDNTTSQASPGISNTDVVKTGISIPVEMAKGSAQHRFACKLSLNGSSQLLMSPVGKETTVHLTSDWNNPSFVGDYLPDRHDLKADGFTADWNVLHLSRNFPQQWTGARYDVSESVLGVSLLMSVDLYQKSMRTVKYAILFIALTFITFFVVEILGGKPAHPIQYLMIGIALLVFYVFLLSLSEHISFSYAYLIASVGVIGLVTAYSTTFLSGGRLIAISATLVVLYGYLYIVLHLQDYALLMGSVILFVALALTMFLTRKIDWFTALTRQNGKG